MKMEGEVRGGVSRVRKKRDVEKSQRAKEKGRKKSEQCHINKRHFAGEKESGKFEKKKQGKIKNQHCRVV